MTRGVTAGLLTCMYEKIPVMTTTAASTMPRYSCKHRPSVTELTCKQGQSYVVWGHLIALIGLGCLDTPCHEAQNGTDPQQRGETAKHLQLHTG